MGKKTEMQQEEEGGDSMHSCGPSWTKLHMLELLGTLESKAVCVETWRGIICNIEYKKPRRQHNKTSESLSIRIETCLVIETFMCC